MGICSTAASNARGNRWLPPSNGKSFDAAEKCAVVENVGCCCCWQQRRCLSLSSRFWQQQQGRLALKQRIAGICAQHKHAGGAPHARTTVPCQNHALGQRSTGVSQGQRSTLSGVTRHRAVICIGAQRGTRPQGRDCGTPQHMDDSRTRTQTCTARARCMVWRGTCWVWHTAGPRATWQNSASWHSVATRPPGKDWHPAAQLLAPTRTHNAHVHAPSTWRFVRGAEAGADRNTVPCAARLTLRWSPTTLL